MIPIRHRHKARLPMFLTALAGASTLFLAFPSAGHSASGIITYSVKGRPAGIVEPTDKTCVKTPGGSNAKNYTFSDLFLFTDADCTIGKEIARAGPLGSPDADFESFSMNTRTVP
jgi:hypothetical protein